MVKIKEILKRVEEIHATIVIDWLSVYFKYNSFDFADLRNDGDTLQIDNDCYFLLLNGGNQHFHKRASIFYKNEDVATMLFDSNNEKIFKKDICKIDFRNKTFYDKTYIYVYNLLTERLLEYKGISRLDIAIDGCNYLMDIFDLYVKREKNKSDFELKNISTTRIRLNANVYNNETYRFENYTIGRSYSKKFITMYNKSLEIDEKSGKKYILDFWHKNNLIQYNSNIYNRKIHGDIYRFELRLSGEQVKRMKDFDFKKLQNNSYLAGIVARNCKNYFEIIRKGKTWHLLPFNRLKAESIEYVERVEDTGTFKAKMLIHGLVADIYNCKIKPNRYNEAKEMIIDRICKYHLQRYFLKKIEEWNSKYYLQTPPNCTDNVTLIIDAITVETSKMVEDYYIIAGRNDNAFATARAIDDYQ